MHERISLCLQTTTTTTATINRSRGKARYSPRRRQTGNWLRFDDKPPPSSAIRNENLPKKYTREQAGNFKSLLGLHTVTELHKSPAKELENTRKHIDMGIENAK